ncbi:MAG TPA: NAD-dependent malic enzyme [Candidatus Krumholzibacteria bacterium]|nr:NAD-dependent malic enzyme [Candidatus Krumholzibacteria bacterium]
MTRLSTGARTRVSDFPHGVELLHNPLLNKGTAFSDAEREALGLRGLLPPRPTSLQEQIARIMANYRVKPSDLERHIFLASLLDRNETLFFRVVVDHLEELMPVIYTPTVGTACQQFGNIFRRARGLFIGADDRGRVDELLGNWPQPDVRAIVVTDGERILGLGDLGANGMGIPIGKLSLYTACAGVHPAMTLPVTIDTGTENTRLLDDPLYLGLRRRRVRGQEYDDLVEEFVTAANRRWPGVLIQFEDFGNQNAFRLLEKYRDRVCTFNDDIQGTAAVTLAGLYSAMRIIDGDLRRQRFLFLGAGEAGVGIADLIVAALMEGGLSERDARRACWLVDSKGLVVAGRGDLAVHKRAYAHEADAVPDLLGAVRAIRPTALIGVSGQASTFTREILETMAEFNARPIVFALSNPTANSECTAEEAYRWTGGRALYASGSPFMPVLLNGTQYTPGQANNAYVFPGIALGIIASRTSRVTSEMFAVAARTLAAQVSQAALSNGLLFPALSSIRAVSVEIAAAVAKVAFDSGLSPLPRPHDLTEFVREQVFEPEYQSYV